jgi:hypothetical protein
MASELKPNEMRLRFKPRQINLEPKDILKISNLAEGEIIEDPLGRHLPGTSFVINHGDIGSVKFEKIMFPSPNPIEFYLYSALKNLENIRVLEPVVKKDYSNVNLLLLEEFQFCIFSVSALEAFLNQIIPNDFEYKDKKLILSKAQIERNWSIEEKLKKAIPQITNVTIAGDAKKWATLTSLLKLRNDLIHLKTALVDSDFRSYQDLYRRLLDHDYEASYIVLKDVISTIGTAEAKTREQNNNIPPEGIHLSWIEWLKKGLKNLTG